MKLEIKFSGHSLEISASWSCLKRIYMARLFVIHVGALTRISDSPRNFRGGLFLILKL